LHVQVNQIFEQIFNSDVVDKELKAQIIQES
jgi:hypothetical protein